LEVRPEADAADDDDVAEDGGWVAGQMDAEGPGGATARVAAGAVGDKCHVADRNGVAVVQDAVDVCGRIGWDGAGGGEKVAAASGGGDVGVVLHDHVPGVGFAENLCGTGHVIEVGLTVEENLCVGVTEAKLLDAVFDLRWGCFEIGVDQDIAGGRGDEVGRKVLAANVVEVVGDLEGGKGRCPLRLDLGVDSSLGGGM
jgi:hypothetical protein